MVLCVRSCIQTTAALPAASMEPWSFTVSILVSSVSLSPRDIEVTVYGVTQKVHAKVTSKNTFAATMARIDKLFSNPLPVISFFCEINAALLNKTSI